MIRFSFHPRPFEFVEFVEFVELAFFIRLVIVDFAGWWRS